MVGSEPLTERTALKEWAVLVDAMARGEIMATVRKGGIREQRAGFSVRHERFLLYPTFFHEKVAELDWRFASRLDEIRRPPDGFIELSVVATVAGVWRVSELAAIRAVTDLQGLTWSAIESRFTYRGNPGVQVVALRAARLRSPVIVPEVRRYAGCVSWVALDDAIDISGAEPVISDAGFAVSFARLREALGEPAE